MPRAANAARNGAHKANGDASEGPDMSGWLDAAVAEQTMRRLCGLWRDHLGSLYALRLGLDGVMEVRTTRPRGKTMRTRGLIRIQWKGDYGRVVWGRVGARALFTIAKLDDSYLMWQSNRSKPFHWDRQEWADEDEPEAEEAGLEEEEWWDETYPGEGWEESWEDGWNEQGWEEECWNGDSWAAHEGWKEESWKEEGWNEEGAWEEGWEDSPAQESVADAAKRRSELRRLLQESRRQVAGTETTKKPSFARWKSQKDKARYKKVDEEEEVDAPAQSSQSSTGDTNASTTIKSLLGITPRKGRHAGARGIVTEEAEVVPKDEMEPMPATPSSASAASEKGPPAVYVATASGVRRVEGPPPPPPPPPLDASEPQPQASAEAVAEAQLKRLLQPAAREQRAPAEEAQAAASKAVVPNDFGVGERLLNELCAGVGGRAGTNASTHQAAAVPGNTSSSSPDAVHVNRLESFVQGFIGQPWFTPQWNGGNNNGNSTSSSRGTTANNSGWAFDLQWVTSTLEWYFSDMNLCGDVYLRSIMMPGEGWVPLMLLLAFPRLQALGVDHTVLGQAAMVANSLELDTTGHYTRIRDKNRRAQWLPPRGVA